MLKKLKQHLKLKIAIFIYLGIFYFITHFFQIPEFIKVCLSVPMFIILSIGIGYFLWIIFKKCFYIKNELNDFSAVSKLSMFFCIGNIFISLIGVSLIYISFFSFNLYFTLITILFLMGLFFFDFKSANRTIKNRLDIVLLILIAVISLIPFIYIRHFTEFPYFSYGDIADDSRIANFLLRNDINAIFLIKGAYLRYLSFISAYLKTFFNIERVVFIYWLLPAPFYLLFSIGTYICLLRMTYSRSFALIGSIFIVWFTGLAKVGGIHHILYRNVIHVLIPYIFLFTIDFYKYLKRRKKEEKQYYNKFLIAYYIFLILWFLNVNNFSFLFFISIGLLLLFILKIIFERKHFPKNFIVLLFFYTSLFLMHILAGLIMVFISGIYLILKQEKTKKLKITILLSYISVVIFNVLVFSISSIENILRQIPILNYSLLKGKTSILDLSEKHEILKNTTFHYSKHIFLIFIILSFFYFIKKKKIKNNHIIMAVIINISFFIYSLPIKYSFRIMSILVFALIYGIGMILYQINKSILRKKTKIFIVSLLSVVFISGIFHSVWIYNYILGYYNNFQDYDENDLNAIEYVERITKKRNSIPLFITTGKTFRTIYSLYKGEMFAQESILSNYYIFNGIFESKDIKNIKIYINDIEIDYFKDYLVFLDKNTVQIANLAIIVPINENRNKIKIIGDEINIKEIDIKTKQENKLKNIKYYIKKEKPNNYSIILEQGKYAKTIYSTGFLERNYIDKILLSNDINIIFNYINKIKFAIENRINKKENKKIDVFIYINKNLLNFRKKSGKNYNINVFLNKQYFKLIKKTDNEFYLFQVI